MKDLCYDMSHHAQLVAVPERDAKDDLINLLKAQIRFMKEKSVRPSEMTPPPHLIYQSFVHE